MSTKLQQELAGKADGYLNRHIADSSLFKAKLMQDYLEFHKESQKVVDEAMRRYAIAFPRWNPCVLAHRAARREVFDVYTQYCSKLGETLSLMRKSNFDNRDLTELQHDMYGLAERTHRQYYRLYKHRCKEAGRLRQFYWLVLCW